MPKRANRKRCKKGEQRGSDAGSPAVVIIRETIHNPNTSHPRQVIKKVLRPWIQRTALRCYFVSFWLAVMGPTFNPDIQTGRDVCSPPYQCVQVNS